MDCKCSTPKCPYHSISLLSLAACFNVPVARRITIVGAKNKLSGHGLERALGLPIQRVPRSYWPGPSLQRQQYYCVCNHHLNICCCCCCRRCAAFTRVHIQFIRTYSHLCQSSHATLCCCGILYEYDERSPAGTQFVITRRSIIRKQTQKHHRKTQDHHQQRRATRKKKKKTIRTKQQKTRFIWAQPPQSQKAKAAARARPARRGTSAFRPVAATGCVCALCDPIQIVGSKKLMLS